MSFHFLTRRSSIDQFVLNCLFIYENKYILDEYQDAWDVSPSINNENRRSCEQKLIKLDKKTLVWYLQQFVRKQSQSWGFNPFIKQTEKKYATCVLLHLIHVFCIPGQEEKMKVVQVELNNVLHTMTEEERYDIFERHISQRLKVKSSLTEIDVLTGQIDRQHQVQMKFIYLNILCAKINDEGCKEFLQQYVDHLVSNIEGEIGSILFKLLELENTKLISCTMLLCLLNWNIYKTPTQVTIQNKEAPASSSDFYFIHAQIEKLVDGNKTKAKYFSLLHLSKLEISDQTTSPIKNNSSQMLLTLNTDCQDFINENALVFVSMVDPVVTSNDVQLLTNLCDVLLCIPYNKHHFHDVTGAINKLIKYYAEEVGINEKICEWIILLGHRLLKNIKHTKDILNHSVDTEIQKDFQKFINFLDDLFTKAIHVGTTYDFLIKAFRTEPYHLNENEHCEYCDSETFTTEFSTKKTEEDKCLKELWKAKLTCKLKTMRISSNLRKKGENFDENITYEICLGYNFEKPHLNFIDAFEAEVEKDHLKATTLEDKIKAILMIYEMLKKSKLSRMLVLLIMLFIVGTSTGHHKSAKLKKYLTLKYEYHMASLYLLWCSGDIEVHPGPTLKKKSLAHDSTIERRWIQNVSQKLIIILPSSIQSKYKTTKNRRNDRENREHFKTLLKKCLEERVHVPKMYLAEINAWETMKYHLLYKLFVYRCEFEAVIASIKDFVNFKGSTKDLTDINVSFNTELKTNEIEMILGKDQRPTNQSQLMVYITRHIAGISIKCAYGKDPDAKCDGLWDLPLENWPKDIILFDPNNRGKYSKKYPAQELISDQELVDNLISLPQVTIPQKYTKIVDAYKLMRKTKTKHNKAELCSIFKRTTSLEKLDYALKNLCKNGIFTKEVHTILSKWWTTRAVEIGDYQKLSQATMDDGEKKERPHISINISTAFISITVDPTIESSSHVKYDFPFNDDLVPLKTMATAVNQITIQLPSSDLKTPDANPVDTQTGSITIPQEAMDKSCSFISVDPIGHALSKSDSDIKLQCKTSTQCPAFGSFTNLNQAISSTIKCSQSNQNIAIAGQPVPISCTHNQSTKTSDDIGHLSATKVSQNLDAHNQVSPTSDMGSSDSISTANSESEKEDSGQNNILKEGQVLMTDSDYSSDSSNNCVSKTSMKKRKCIEEDRNEMKKRIKPSLKQDKKQSETTNHIKIDSSTTSNKNMELLLDCLDIDLDLFDIDEQTFDVELNALDNEDKTLYISDKDKKDGNLENVETQILNENTNTNESVYKTNVSTELEKFLQDMINCEGEKMSQMKSYV